jgi:uncharacterized membrane protein
VTLDSLRRATADTTTIGESRLPPVLAVLTAAALYATLPSRFISGSSGFLTSARFFVPALALALLVPLALSAPKRTPAMRTLPRRLTAVQRRTAAIFLIAVISAANAVSIVLLVHFITVGRQIQGHELVRAAIHIWCTTVITFALWFWQLDSGGPAARARARTDRPDFLFTQMTNPDVAPAHWRPAFLDYLYLSFTNATAFSPTDTLPLTHWAKMLMLVESAASLLTLLMVAARAVNILS